MTRLIRELLPGPLDIVGDIHGEIDALDALLERLGYDHDGIHSQGRRLVFVGDLCDRGPDSPAVVRLVQQLVENGLAQCVLGNHELNILRGEEKHGNHWFFGDADPKHLREFGPAKLATRAEADSCRRFFAQLPVALERDDLRVAHAAWHTGAIESVRRSAGNAAESYAAHEERANATDEAKRLAERHAGELARHPGVLEDLSRKPPALPGVAEYEEYKQMSNPLRIVTSGVERVAARPYPASGKWRLVERVRWWRAYRDAVPVIFGHYWRWWDPPDHTVLSKGEPNMFDGDPPDGWQKSEEGKDVGLCVDYSVGARFKERLRGRRARFAGRLAALRWPERELVFDRDA